MLSWWLRWMTPSLNSLGRSRLFSKRRNSIFIAKIPTVDVLIFMLERWCASELLNAGAPNCSANFIAGINCDNLSDTV